MDVVGPEKVIVAVTGGSGFIGERLVQRSIDNGDHVRILTRKSLSKRDCVEYYMGDLTDPNIELYDFLDNVDVLYHCAGEISNESLMYQLHVGGVARLLEQAEGRVKRWVQLSSVGAYGECRSGVVTEATAENPVGTYEKTKTLSDELIQESGLPYVILRPSNVFGQSMRNQSLFQLIRMVKNGLFFYIGKPGVLVNYVHVDDVVEALLKCGRHKSAVGNVYNLSQTTEIERMVDSFLSGFGGKRTVQRFPESLVRIIARIFSMIPGFPLTISRIDALTIRAEYDSNKIINELDFNFKKDLDVWFFDLAAGQRE